jgi:hypothetical protein
MDKLPDIGRKDSDNQGLKLPRIGGSHVSALNPHSSGPNIIGIGHAYQSPYLNHKYLSKHHYAAEKLHGHKVPYNSPFKLPTGGSPLKSGIDSIKGTSIIGVKKVLGKSPHSDLSNILGSKQLILKNQNPNYKQNVKKLNYSELASKNERLYGKNERTHKISSSILMEKKKSIEHKKENEIY